MFISEERKEKAERIKELEEAGFNISRFRFLPPLSSEDRVEEVLNWASKIHDNNLEQIFNIRTYKYYPHIKKETAQNPHLTDLSFDELAFQLPIQIFEYACLIDAETPDNGRIAGNISIEENKKFSLEFVIKEKRAMVRDINTHRNTYSIYGDYNNPVDSQLVKYNTDLEKLGMNLLTFSNRLVLGSVIKEAFSLNKENIILEFTYFSIPSGIFYNTKDKVFPKKHIVWWEYRKF